MPAHGTRSCYVHDNCRCKPCTTANREHQRQLVARPVEPKNHGTLLGYNRGCRCEACSALMSQRNRQAHARRKALGQPS